MSSAELFDTISEFADENRALRKQIEDLERRLAQEQAVSEQLRTLANIHGRRMLEAERRLAQTWQPVEDGEHPTSHDSVRIKTNGGWVGIYEEDEDTSQMKFSESIVLYPNIRLCRRIAPTGAPEQVAVPVEAIRNMIQEYGRGANDRELQEVDTVRKWLDSTAEAGG